MMGFTDYQDLLGFNMASINLKFFTFFSISFGSLVGFIETWTGISIYLWLFLTLGSIFDIAFGIYANIIVLQNEFKTDKFFRGIFKSFVVLFIIFITNTLNMGVHDSQINPELLRVPFEYISATIHYSFIMLICIYLLSGISENGAKIDIPVFNSLSKILKIKIKKIEDI